MFVHSYRSELDDSCSTASESSPSILISTVEKQSQEKHWGSRSRSHSRSRSSRSYSRSSSADSDYTSTDESDGLGFPGPQGCRPGARACLVKKPSRARACVKSLRSLRKKPPLGSASPEWSDGCARPSLRSPQPQRQQERNRPSCVSPRHAHLSERELTENGARLPLLRLGAAFCRRLLPN